MLHHYIEMVQVVSFLLTFSGESAGKWIKLPRTFFRPREVGLFGHANLHADTLTSLSPQNIPTQNLEKTAVVKNRCCVFSIKSGPLHNCDNYMT